MRSSPPRPSVRISAHLTEIAFSVMLLQVAALNCRLPGIHCVVVSRHLAATAPMIQPPPKACPIRFCSSRMSALCPLFFVIASSLGPIRTVRLPVSSLSPSSSLLPGRSEKRSVNHALRFTRCHYTGSSLSASPEDLGDDTSVSPSLYSYKNHGTKAGSNTHAATLLSSPYPPKVSDWLKIFGRLAEHAGCFSWGLANNPHLVYRNVKIKPFVNYMRAPWMEIFKLKARLLRASLGVPQEILAVTDKQYELRKLRTERTAAQAMQLSLREFVHLMPLLPFKFPYDAISDNMDLFRRFCQSSGDVLEVEIRRAAESAGSGRGGWREQHKQGKLKMLSCWQESNYSLNGVANEKAKDNICERALRRCFEFFSCNNVITIESVKHSMFRILKHREKTMKWNEFYEIMTTS
eukprot:GHVQ01005946.1.p1 GENE.GHVQ01005946.1~~GHVQ01005946.1.p1  ORF type:complete len:407 (+),score=34.59 GHVQ01005946.1:531-1751(+)